MSTAAPPQLRFDRDESQRRVKHPLQTVRKYIRVYVLLEGAAIAVLFLAAWFWAGLLLDYGTFRLFAFDWLQELRDVGSENAEVRMLLGIVGVGLVFASTIALTVFIARRMRAYPILVFLGCLFFFLKLISTPIGCVMLLSAAVLSASVFGLGPVGMAVALVVEVALSVLAAFAITRFVLGAVQRSKSPGSELAARIVACIGWVGPILISLAVALGGLFSLIPESIYQQQIHSAYLLRVILLAVLLAVLIAVATTKVVLRWLREFNDRAVALVLERRFPRELGDRLITAVELADMRAAKGYGYSQAMVEHTIQDCVERIDRLPVASVFNWRRLVGWWALVGLATFGVLVVVAIGTLAIGMATGDLASPLELPWRMKDVAMIWTERNMLVQDSYWPRRSYLEIARFQAKHNSPNEMRVPRDELRPELQVRAVEWVVADRSAPDGWRALRWADLDKYIDPALLARVNIPEDWPHWIVDMDDLNPSVPNGLVPMALHERTTGEVRKAIVDDAALVKNLQQAQAMDAVDELVNWKRWTVDKIAMQDERPRVRVPLRETDAYAALVEVLEKLNDLAASPSMSRTLRKLVIPTEVIARSRGETSSVSEPCIRQQGEAQKPTNKFAFDLNKLKETSRLRMQGEDYYTPVKLVTLVAPPSVRALSVDKAEPAYLYHRLQDGDQAPLKDKKQFFRNFPVSVVGEMSTIDVPIGTDVIVRAESDRKLREPVRIKAPTVRETGAVVPEQSVQLAADGMSFQVDFNNVVRTLDFMFEFNDEDNVRGRRHVRIRPVDDLPPRFEGDVGLGVVLRKPRARGADAKLVQGTVADGFLITPDALLPFLGLIRDDHGLTRVGWLFEVEPVDVELVGAGKDAKEKLPTLVLGGNTQMRRASLIASTMQFNPANAASRLALPGYFSWVDRVLEADLSRSGLAQEEKFVMMEEFKALLQRKSVGEIPATAVGKALGEPARPLSGWEFSLRDEEGFDVKKQLPKLKVANPQKQGQLHYMLKVSVLATDNNVEGGKEFQYAGKPFWGNSTRSKSPFQFLVVTENELLSQVSIEEESLFERLDGTYEKLKNAKTIADEQATKLAGTTMKDDELGLVAIRLDEIRKTVIDAGSATREVYAAYANILKELQVNRVHKDRVEKVEDKIVWPLGQAVDPKDGNFVKTDDLYQKAYTEADDDAQANRGLVNRARHLDTIRKSGKEMDALIERIRSVVNAMNEGVAESKLIESLIVMERSERRAAEILAAIRLQVELETLKLIQGK